MLTVSPLTVTLVDDNDLSVAGLQRLLTTYTARVELRDLRAALQSPGDLDVVLYEPFLATPTVTSLFEDLTAASDAQPVTFSWAHPDDLTGCESRPYLSKSLTASQIVRSLEDLCAGRPVPAPPARTAPTTTPTIDAPRPAAAVPKTQHPRVRSPMRDDLTAREVQVLTLITQGLSNAEVGEELGLSINSIKTHVRTAYQKIGVCRRTQAVAWGLEHGLLDLPAGAAADLMAV